MLKPLILWSCLIFKAWTLFGQSPERVYYSSFRPEGWDIYLSGDGGKSFKPIAEDPALDYDPVISPDGKWLVFTSEREGMPRLYIQSIDQAERPRLLVNSASMQDQLVFSPDGKWCAFVSTHQGNAEIYKLPFIPDSVMDIRQAINLTNHPGGDFRPAWSPDGSTLVFSSDRDHAVKPHSEFPFAMYRTGNLYSMDTSGSAPERLTRTETWDGSPKWSLDGKQIYFYSLRSGMPQIYQMNKDGSSQKRISPVDLKAISPCPLNDSLLVFTHWTQEDRGAFKFMVLNLNSLNTEIYYRDSLAMYGMVAGPKDLRAFHGGKIPLEEKTNAGGFAGHLLVRGPMEQYALPEKTVRLYGVRRAFAAPPDPHSPSLVFAAEQSKSIQEVLLTKYSAVLLLFPAGLLLLIFFGLYRAIRDRLSVKPWKNVLAMSALLILSIAVLTISGYEIFASSNSLSRSRTTFLLLAIPFLILCFYFFRKGGKASVLNSPFQIVYRTLGFGTGLLCMMLVYLIVFYSNLFNLNIDFLKVNHETGAVEWLFTFKPGHSKVSQILDIKYKPDGSSLLFTAGLFRNRPSAPGEIWEYRFMDKELKKISLFGSNQGFADFSADNTSMLFRGGHTGNFDIYLKTKDQIENLTHSPWRENFPALSPDGNKVVYCSDINGKRVDSTITTMNIHFLEKQPDRSWGASKQITHFEGQEAHPHFSPDGLYIIYTTEEFGINDEQPLSQEFFFSPQLYGEIVAKRLDDGQTFRLTHNKWEDGAPLWVKGY